MNNLTDCISRQAVIDLMMQKWGENFSGDDAMQESIDAIRVMPSVTPQEPKTAHWEYGYAFADGNYCKCSECKEIIKCIYPMHYCPNCGAKMVEQQESEET